MRRLVAGLLLVAAIATGCGGGGGSAASFCDDARELDEKFTSLEDGDFSTETFRDILNELRGLTPPDEIKESYETLIEGFETLVNALEDLGDVDFTDPEVFNDPAVAAAFEQVSAQEFTDASEEVEAYLSDECGIDTES